MKTLGSTLHFLTLTLIVSMSSQAAKVDKSAPTDEAAGGKKPGTQAGIGNMVGRGLKTAATVAASSLLRAASSMKPSSRSRKIGTYQVRVSRARDEAHVALLNGVVYVIDKPVEVAGDGPA